MIDFVIVERKLAVELDGDTHALPERQAREVRRAGYLAERGWTVIRFTNREVFANLDGVMPAIGTALKSHPHPDPLPHAGEGADIA